jgi:hypothetical protein
MLFLQYATQSTKVKFHSKLTGHMDPEYNRDASQSQTKFHYECIPCNDSNISNGLPQH